MTVWDRIESLGLRVVMGLPAAAQRRLGGRPVVRDGLTLDPDVQLLLRLQRLTREPGAETLPMADGRRAIRRITRLNGGRQPVGSVRHLRVAGLPARLYVPTGAAPTGPLLLFFHGGGFMHGDLDSHDAPCRFLAERAGVRVLAVDYRLGPEEPFPAAYDDALAALRWLREHATEVGADPGRIGVGGDSAGGNLAAGVALDAARSGVPLAFQLLVYPATDAARTTASADLFAEGFYLTKAYLELANESYAVDADLRDPRLSPAYADLPTGVAPAYVATAGFDPLRDEGEAYARRLVETGVAVELRRFEGQVHGFFNITGVGRSSRAANVEISEALRAGLAAR